MEIYGRGTADFPVNHVQAIWTRKSCSKLPDQREQTVMRHPKYDSRDPIYNSSDQSLLWLCDFVLPEITIALWPAKQRASNHCIEFYRCQFNENVVLLFYLW